MAKASWWALGLGLGLIGCGPHGDEGSGGSHGHDLSGSSCPPASTVTYETFGRDFLGRYCTQCHASSLRGAERRGAPSDHDLDTLGAARAIEAGHLDEVAAAGPERVNAAMPPSGSPQPTVEDRRTLGEWIACGLP